MAEAARKYAVVTGANKGIGFEICRQLICQGVYVILTARDERKGLEALEKLVKETGFSDSVMFHRLDVVDSESVASVAEFITSQFGKLDILVNNAGTNGAIVDGDALKAAVNAGLAWTERAKINWNDVATQTYELASEAILTNYYGAKRTVEALVPLLKSSPSPRIVNVASSMGQLKNISNEWAKGVLKDAENLTEERIDRVLDEFLKDFKEGSIDAKGWPPFLGAYTVSKSCMIAYTKILARKYSAFRVN